MKKLISVLLVIAMIAAMSVVSFADYEVPGDDVLCVSYDEIRPGILCGSQSPDPAKTNTPSLGEEAATQGAFFWGWIGAKKDIKGFSYKLDGGDAVTMDSYKVAPEGPVVDAAKATAEANKGYTDTVYSSRFGVTVPVKAGTNEVEIYADFTDGTSEVFWKATVSVAGEVIEEDVVGGGDVTSTDDFAKGPGEYTLKNDITGIFHTPAAGGKFVIDLNGKTWTCTADILLQVKDNAEVIVKNGTLVSIEGATDTIDIVGNAKLTLENVKVKGNVGSADAIFVNSTSSSVIVIDNCDLSAGKAGIDNTSATADITVIGGKFSVYGEGADGTGRSCAIELRNNAKIKLVDNIDFEQNAIICRTATHTNSWAESIILGEGASISFSDNVDLGSASGNQYTQVTVSYTPPEVVEPEPETGDFGLIALAFVALSSVVVKKRKAN